MRYRVRLEDPDSDEARVVNVSADSPEAAQEICEARERRQCETVYTDAQLEEADAMVSKRKKAAGRRAFRRVVHEQTVPYEVVSVTARDEGVSATKADRKAAAMKGGK